MIPLPGRQLLVLQSIARNVTKPLYFTDHFDLLLFIRKKRHKEIIKHQVLPSRLEDVKIPELADNGADANIKLQVRKTKIIKKLACQLSRSSTLTAHGLRE
jgi:hypothetical protein